MNKKWGLISIVLVCVSYGSSGWASSISNIAVAFATIHFPSHLNGREVLSVAAHVGIVNLEERRYTTPPQKVRIWEDVHHTPLPKAQDARDGHFFGKIELTGGNWINGGGSGKVESLAIQYWIEFKDGSNTEISETIYFPYDAVVSDEYDRGRYYQEKKTTFDRIQDARRTEVIWYNSKAHG